MAEVKTVPVLFSSESIVLPGMVVPIELDDAARAAVDAARASESGELLIAPRLDDRYPSYGVLATIVQIGRMVGGPAAVVRGGSRAHIGAGATGPGAALWVEVTEVAENQPGDETFKLAAEYKKLLLAMLQRREAWQIIDFVNQLSDPSALADTAGYASYLTQVQKRQLLETPDVAERLRALIEWTGDQLAEVEVNEKIAEDVREGMEKTQKEFLLRQQLAAIRKELGDDDGTGSSDDYRSRIEAADLPDNVREAALREVGKLERAGDQSPESGWIRTWLDTVLDLPWSVHTDDSTDLKAARDILDADHHGLEDVKDRIVEYLAVRARRAQRGLQVVGGRGSGAVMVLAGPPGVGKTSLGESVARALGRKFVRVALGGVRDEAEIRGHRRTYVGALPGRIVRAIGEAGSMNPVVLLDEIDKVGSDFRGDPAAALLEVLDPAQNHTFRDHYLDLDLDLSDVVFLATANVIENIPSALLDRMELVQIDGYTEDDKVAIARDFLLPRQRERAALTDGEVEVTDAALRKVAADYTREPGVRQFERLLAKAMRKVTTKLASTPGPIVIDEPDLVEYLGRPRFLPESAERTAVPGVATGLAVTGLGGDVLYIEAGATDGEPGLQLTGQLGDVMKESAQIALSYVRSHAEQLGVDPKALDRRIHVHVPAGAVPKDGPSAGVTMVTALVSMATGRQVRSDVGMTGEVTLNGRVLPIGGVKQKLLAAQRAGLATVFIPQRNEADLDDVPADVLDALEVKPMTDVADIVAQALAPVEERATVAA
ncbi:ATP-dependent Lon protease [Mycolicibacterium rutilum]|uniref:Lon protease n=1 Tax=Mycolicibacterium rutilum TaxID=370526 RepID=A0A1H6KRY7_MYCRU|nr:endopeptidase La [Mycolicibacterium rutilum]SEH78392.1 ATP-dependent Lon protease [Mycolicibacterium rutilum]